jgi:hypothetical protein
MEVVFRAGVRDRLEGDPERLVLIRVMVDMDMALRGVERRFCPETACESTHLYTHHRASTERVVVEDT